MPPWCWPLYLGVGPLALWTLLAWRTIHWQVATDWYAFRFIVWLLAGLLTLSLVLAAFVASTRDPAERLAFGKRKRTIWLLTGLLTMGAIAGGVGINMIHTRIERTIAEAEPSVKDFYHNGDTTRLVARVIRMMLLKQRESTTDPAIRATLKALADHVLEAWEELATKQTNETDEEHASHLALIAGIDEAGLADYLFDRHREALDTERWSTLITQWTAATSASPLPESTRVALITSLHTTFAVTLRESIKLAYEQNDKSWPAMQIDMAAHLMANAKRDVSEHDAAFRRDLAALFDETASLAGVIATLDDATRLHHAQTIEHFTADRRELDKFKNDVARIDANSAETLERVKRIQDILAPHAISNGMAAPVLDDALERSIRQMIATGNLLETAAAEVAAAASGSMPDRWHAADAAIAQCGVWRASQIDWTEREEFQFLIVQSDRALYGERLGDALGPLEQAVKLQSSDWNVNVRLAFVLSHIRTRSFVDGNTRAATIYTQLLPPAGGGDLRDALVFNNLGELYATQGKYTAAEAQLQRALTIYETALGPTHPLVGICINNIGTLYCRLGKYKEAEVLLQRSLTIKEAIDGGDDRQVALSLSNLAMVYDARGEYAEAEQLYARALAINESIFGSRHPTVAISLNNLAGIHNARGDLSTAEQLYRRALAIDEAELSPDDPGLAVDLNNLGELCRVQGRYREAASYYQQAIAIRESALAPDHPDLAQSLNNRALLYVAQGRYEDAEADLRRAMAIHEASLGPGHPDVATNISNLAYLYKMQARYAEAEPLYERALSIDEKALGKTHPAVASDLNNQGEYYRSQGKYEIAEPLLKRSLAINEITFGPNHADVAMNLNNLGSLYKSTQRYADAEEAYSRSLVIRERSFGTESAEVAQSLNNWGELKRVQGQFEEAEVLLKRAIVIRERATPNESPLAISLHNLGSVYLDRKQYDAAEPLFKRALDIWTARLGEQHPYVAMCLDKLARVYRHTDRTKEAQELEERAKAIRAIAR